MAKKKLEIEADLNLDPDDVLKTEDLPDGLKELNEVEYSEEAKKKILPWMEQFDSEKLEKASRSSDYPAPFHYRAGTTHNFLIIKAPFVPEKEDGSKMTKVITKDGKDVTVEVWALLINYNGRVLTWYPDQLSLFKLGAFKMKHELSETQLIGKKVQTWYDDLTKDGKKYRKYYTKYTI